MSKRIIVLGLAIILVMALCAPSAFAAGKAPSPTVSITAPASGATVSGTAVAISASCASGGTGYTVTGVTYKIDSGSNVAMSGPNGTASGTWTASWNSTTVANGSHTISVTVTNSGRKTATATRTVTVSNGTTYGNPTVSITAPANGATVSGTAVAINASGVTGTNATLTSVKYAIDGGTAVNMTTSGGTTANSSYTATANWNSTGVANGSHTIAVTTTNSGAKTATTQITVTVSNAAPADTYKVIAYNDLGMHCACPNSDTMLLLPPYNTIRAQVIHRYDGGPDLITSGITMEYDTVEETEADLLADAEYLKWLDNANTHFPGSGISRTNIIGLTGNRLDGHMEPNGNNWIAEGIPIFPKKDAGGVLDYFGEKRDPYLTARITAKNTSGQVLGQTTTVMPVAFGGCCSCHLQLATTYYGRTPTNVEAFQHMALLHRRAAPQYDLAAMMPVRCSKCHLDPAVGGSAALDHSIGTATTTFSEALHLYHARTAAVKAMAPNIESDCYQCHPDNKGVNCYRGVHSKSTGANLWCTNCHGTISARTDRTDYKTPWMYNSLPQCADCHQSDENARNAPLFGLFLASSGHQRDQIDCLTCHGSPHAELPSTLADDNVQNQNLQNDSRALGVCDTCHTSKSTTWGIPPM